MSQEYVSKSQFKARAFEHFRQVETSDDSIVITDRGKPTLQVRRYRSDQRSPLEILRGRVVEYKRPTEPVAEDDWEAVS